MRDVYWTTGQYDMVVIAEGADEALAALLLSVGRLAKPAACCAIAPSVLSRADRVIQ